MALACRYTAAGYENADLCAWTFSQATFPAGGGLANVRWNCPAAAKKQGCISRYYLIQVRCASRTPPRSHACAPLAHTLQLLCPHLGGLHPGLAVLYGPLLGLHCRQEASVPHHAI